MTWTAGGTLFVWERPLSKTDRRDLGDDAPDGAILGARVEHVAAKEAYLAAREGDGDAGD